MYAPQDNFVYDYWYIAEGGQYHLFILQAPRSLGDPDKRHLNTTIGHIVSTDLVHWERLPDPLVPDHAYERDGTATGSVVKRGDEYCMLYTGLAGKRKTICLATSHDLIHWSKYRHNPVLEVDDRLYDPEGTWADPFVVFDEASDGYYAVFKAHDIQQPAGLRGCAGAAFSKDLISWEALPPVFSPGLYREPEVPAVYKFDQTYFLICMTIPPVWSDKLKAKVLPRKPQWGDIYMTSDKLLGPYGPPEGIELTRTEDEAMMVRIIERSPGDYVSLSWWQGYEDYWVDWCKTHDTSGVMPCVLQNPRRIFVDAEAGALRIGPYVAEAEA